MARIRGTRGSDELFGTELSDQIFGARGADFIYAGTADVAVGGQGNDRLDSAGSPGAQLIGGAGDDTLIGFGDLRGDERPGLPERAAGDDRLSSTMYFDTTLGTQRGGLGNDVFAVGTHADGVWSELDVLDFRPGEDKVAISVGYTEGPYEAGFLDQNRTFAALDTNGNGTLGDDVPVDGNSQAWHDIDGDRFIIRLHEDFIVLKGVASLSAADWEFF